MWFILLAVFCAAAHASPLDGVAKNALDGKRVYVRVWSENEALNHAKEGMKDLLERSEELAEVTPDLLPMTIHAEDGSHVHGLLLQRNRRIEHPLKIAVGGEEEYVSLVGESEAHYQDTMSHAVFGMRQLQDQRHFDGSFHYDGVPYELHPMEEDGAVRARGLENHRPHMITRAEIHTYSEPLMPSGELLAKIGAQSQEQVEKRNNRYDVEMALIVDYGEYLRWLTETGSESAAIAAVKYKFSYIYNGMDRIYRTLDAMGITIIPWLNKLDIQTSASQSAVNEMYDNDVDEAGAKNTKVDGGAILSYLLKWGPKHEYSVPGDFDHVMYWISYTMHYGGNYGTIGLAYVGTVCGDLGFSLIEDTGFESFRTAAHELGHGLGSHHDNGASADCDPNLNHIMAPWEGIADDSRTDDGWRFSTCSVEQFHKILAGVGECVLRNEHDNDFDPVWVNPLPGQKYDAAWQCGWANMDTSGTWTHCDGDVLQPDECYYGISCTGPDYTCGTQSVRPVDGTLCTNGWCYHGACQ